MSTSAATVIECDTEGCTARIVAIDGRSHAQRDAREEGWYADKYLSLCPEHREF